MSNKIKCTCGHSWNKSSSSKKDMNICHICGKDTTMQMGGFVYPVNYVPQKENGGWLDAYDDTPQAENGIEGTMGGLTDKGFNYNGAWGGPSMQMGGAMPGSVGFTYARTQGIPSEGPYTKKTMPSAQNGGEMKFYQEGLDWKPRNISRDGSEIPQAQLGLHMLTPDYSQVGENIMEMLSFPQKALTKLISGKYQTPSKAMGIKNKAGAIATDMILDPLNLMGAGAVAKTTGAYKNAYKLNPWAFKANPEDYYRMIGETGFDDAMSSGLIRSKKMDAYPEPYFGKGKIPDGEYSNPKSTAINPKTRKRIPTRGYPGPYMIQSKVPMKGVGAWADEVDPLVGTPSETVDAFDPRFTFYKQDWLKGYKEVSKPKKKEKGGEITKDDNGYWNPENWGEPVEIGSNEITMQGVYEPLLGISDTGDTQMMYPGEDYTFDGESVTEYPVKKNGGWLDKYN